MRLLYTVLFLFSFINLNAQTRPNVLFIMADDMRPEIGSYGIERAITPNLDDLSKAGVTFKRAYSQQAICSASRASMLSSLRPDVTGCDYPYSDYYLENLLPQYPTLFGQFNNIGYEIQSYGKIHHGYTESFMSDRDDRLWTTEYYDPDNLVIWNNTPGGRKEKIKQLPPFELADQSEEIYGDYKIAQHTMDYLKAYDFSSGKPFFLACGFYKPHAPYVAPKKYADPIDINDIEIPENYDSNSGVSYSTTLTTIARYKLEDNLPNGTYYSEDRAKEIIRAYLACCSFVDAQVGRVIQALEEVGQLENTIIVFTSDHGYHLGDHNSIGKETNYECAAITPLIVIDPRTGVKDVQSNALVELVDIYPTLIDMVGETVPDFLEGTSFKKLLTQPDHPWKTAAFSQYNRDNVNKQIEGYSMRTDKYRFTQWFEMDGNERGTVLGEELYDHDIDPLETNNLAEDDAQMAIIEQLRIQLEEGWKSALPEGYVNHSNHVLAPRALSVEYLEKFNFSYGPNPASDLVRLSAAKNITSIKVINVLGQEVMNAQPEQRKTSLDISNLNEGVYILKVAIKDEIGTFKIIKK